LFGLEIVITAWFIAPSTAFASLSAIYSGKRTGTVILVDFTRHKKPREVLKLAGFGTS
jgi:hypothetical protein